MAQAAQSLQVYAEELTHFAPRINLISLEDLRRINDHHLIPALRLAADIALHPRSRILDVGSGAGLPGIPLALALPASRFTLVEARRRRSNFLRHCVRTLHLTNVDVVNGRVEDLRTGPNDIVLSRAVGGLRQLQEAAAAHLSPHGVYLTTRGPNDDRPTPDHEAKAPASGPPGTVVTLHRATCG
ncbi:MAG: 16S rRNA (guanine(527)-N(7))-methyltransferase RsmG [Gemmatimonadetes bacterium]|nr:16S rRNA (guanine(527)-N(7))-methyltransferase RsmG [Gemmatimonadota bacterium]MBT6145939.1 16S rRNA (guanine(527)-N(7))-methyltransferase RsmG [Gemmatimonadota bacterium]MBT7864552.1 16S rRNA (guanine(527)-N(7))-methyltransferase RsmG [Gemmatimonadota bacterium]